MSSSTVIGRVATVCPLTALEVFRRQDTQEVTVLVGNGSTLDVYDLYGDVVHGGRIIVFGGKCLQLLDSGYSFAEGGKMVLPDMILDCEYTINGEFGGLLYVAYAHNFVDVYSLAVDEGTSKLMYRMQNSCKCVLFSMTLSIDTATSNVQLACGTAFGKVLIWQFPMLIANTLVNHEERVVQDPSKELVGHTGVVFRVSYNLNRSKIASVSDDRTVRVWDLGTFSQIFIGWGHVCRVWDVIFYGDNEIITTGEECFIKVWDISKGVCESSFQGHRGKSCWRIADVGDGKHLVSVGNDSSVKVWNFHSQCLSTPEESLHSQKVNISDLYDYKSISTEEKSTKKKKGVALIEILPGDSKVLLVMIDGAIVVVDVLGEQNSTALIAHTESPICSADAKFSNTDISIAVSHPEGSVTVFKIKYCTKEMFSYALENQICWKAYLSRVINLWLLSVRGTLYLLTALPKGFCQLWQLDNCCSASLQVKSCTTCREDIATAATISSLTNILFIGDAKGMITIYHFDDLADENMVQALRSHCPEPVSMIYTEEDFGSLNAINERRERSGIYTLGHDGYLNVITVNRDGIYRILYRLSTFPISSPDFLMLKCHGPDLSVYVGGYQSSLYYIYDVRKGYEILRVEAGGWKRPHCRSLLQPTNPYAVPMPIFASVVPDRFVGVNGIGNREQMCIEIHGNTAHSITDHPSFAGTLGTCSNGKVSYVGDLITLPRQIGGCLAVVAGEDGNLRCFSILNDNNLSFQQEIEFPYHRPIRAMSIQQSDRPDSTQGIVVAGGGNLQYAIYLFDMSVLVRNDLGALVSTLPLNTLLTLAAEGSTWDRAEQEHRILSISLCSFPSDKYLVCLNDARGKVTVLSFDYQNLVLHGNSFGRSDPAKLYNHREDFEGSENPIISSCIVKLFARQSSPPDGSPEMKRICPDEIFSNTAVLILGDNAGMVYCFQIAATSVRNSIKLGQYEAHSMGADSIHAVQCEAFSTESLASLIIVSGGDDQGVSVTLVDIKNSKSDPLSLTMDILLSYTFEGCHTSAITGLKIYLDATAESHLYRGKILTVGYDQRLTLWELCFDSHLLPTKQVQSYEETSVPSKIKSVSVLRNALQEELGMSFSWKEGFMVDVGDVQGLKIKESLRYNTDEIDIWAIVVGEGFQIFDIRT